MMQRAEYVQNRLLRFFTQLRFWYRQGGRKVTLFTSLGKRNPETAEKYICVSVFFSSFGVLPRAPSAEADCKKQGEKYVQDFFNGACRPYLKR